MDDTLKRIKRAVLAGRVGLTLKAELEMDRDALTREEVIESIVFAPAIHKTIRSTSSRRSTRRELLHIIIGASLRGTLIYTKGKLIAQGGVETYYILVSAKRSD